MWMALGFVSLSGTKVGTLVSFPAMGSFEGSSHALGIARVSFGQTAFVVKTPMPADSPTLKGVSIASPSTSTIDVISSV